VSEVPSPPGSISANLTELRDLCRAVSSPKFGGGVGGGCPDVQESSVFSLILLSSPPGSISADLAELRDLCRAVSSPKFGEGVGGGCPDVRESSVFSLILLSSPPGSISADLTELRDLCRAVSSPKFGGGVGGGCPDVRESPVFSLILLSGSETKYLPLCCSRQLHSLNLALMPRERRKTPATFWRRRQDWGRYRGGETPKPKNEFNPASDPEWSEVSRYTEEWRL